VLLASACALGCKTTPVTSVADGAVASVSAHDTDEPVAPRGEITLGAASSTVYIPTLERAVAGMRSRFRACYNTGMQLEPRMEGAATITAAVHPNGEVASAAITSAVGLSSGVTTCFVRAVERAQFDAPGGVGATVTIPLTCAPRPAPR
jgi:hypothetical protein